MIAGTDDEGLNEDIYSVCKCLGILVNVISDRTKCDFHFPGIVKRDTLVAGVNAGGRDHGRAKRARQAIEKALDDFTGGRITMAAPEKILCWQPGEQTRGDSKRDGDLIYKKKRARKQKFRC